MSRLAILAPLLLLSGIVIAQIDAPPDSSCSPLWQWTFNSLGQNPCTIAAYLLATCNGGSFSIAPLGPGYSYVGPSGVDDGNLCKCNTVAYSLLSACDGCQQEKWITWSQYSSNCTKDFPVSTFPNPVPSGTRVPQWALCDVTLENNWNNNTAFTVGASPELTPGMAVLNASATSQIQTPTPSPMSMKMSSSNSCAIIGGVLGGVILIALAGLAIFWLRRRRMQAPSATFVVDGAPQPLRPPGSDDGTYVPSSTPVTPATGTPMKFYDPNDPTTFPWYQGAGQVHTEVPVAQYRDSGNTLTYMQNSGPHGYHGFPTV